MVPSLLSRSRSLSGPLLETLFPEVHYSDNPPADIREEDDSYVVDLSVPGFEPDELDVHMEDGYLVVSGQHEEAKTEYVSREIYRSSFRRSFRIRDIPDDGLEADLRNGILSIRVPKMKPERKKIEVKSSGG